MKRIIVLLLCLIPLLFSSVRAQLKGNEYERVPHASGESTVRFESFSFMLPFGWYIESSPFLEALCNQKTGERCGDLIASDGARSRFVFWHNYPCSLMEMEQQEGFGIEENVTMSHDSLDGRVVSIYTTPSGFIIIGVCDLPGNHTFTLSSLELDKAGQDVLLDIFMTFKMR